MGDILVCRSAYPRYQLMVQGSSCNFYYSPFAVKPYNPKTTLVSLQALYKLEGGEREIKVISKLKPKLRDFRERAQIHELQAFKYGSMCPIVDVYINSWLDDPKCKLPPTWENFLTVLRDIELGEVADDISTYLTNTSPPPIPIAGTHIQQLVYQICQSVNDLHILYIYIQQRMLKS